MTIHNRERAVFIDFRRANRELCFPNQFVQCIASLETNILNIFQLIDLVFQWARTSKNKLNIRQQIAGLNKCVDSLLFREAAEV